MDVINYRLLRNSDNIDYKKYFDQFNYPIVYKLLNIFNIDSNNMDEYIKNTKYIYTDSRVYISDDYPTTEFEKEYLLEVSKSARIIICVLQQVIDDSKKFNQYLEMIKMSYNYRYIDNKVIYQALLYANYNADLEVREKLLNALFKLIDKDYLINYEAGKQKLIDKTLIK